VDEKHEVMRRSWQEWGSGANNEEVARAWYAYMYDYCVMMVQGRFRDGAVQR